MRAPEETLLGFARALRAAGVRVTQDRAQAYVEAVSVVGLEDPTGVYAAGRATLCASPDDLERHDQVFAAWFTTDAQPARTPGPRPPATVMTDLPTDDAEGEGGDADEAVRARSSATEVLRHRDVATLSAAERERLAAMFAGLRARAPRRRTPRRRPASHGQVDPGRTLRASLRRMGEPARIEWRRRGTRQRRAVLLIDVSGSMSGYADALLRLAHRVATGPDAGPTEVFTLGTRLTHLTAALRHRDPERALAAAGDTVPDWSGGTRLGETLRAFLDRRRDLARGAVVVVFSDGWERGDAVLLAEQTERLHRLAHRVVWVNPHRGKAGYEPVQGGIRAVLPHVDDFVAGHSLATYARLLEVIADA